MKRMLRYGRPLIVNAQKMTQFSLKVDPNQQVFCHIDFVKPGRHVYCVSHHEPEPSLLNMQQRDFYVHDTLAPFRDDPIPCCKSPTTPFLTIRFLLFSYNRL